MATQKDPATSSNKSSANSPTRRSKSIPPEIISHTVVKDSSRTVEALTGDQRPRLIAIEAYYLTEKRNFHPGHEVGRLAAEITVAAANPVAR